MSSTRNNPSTQNCGTPLEFLRALEQKFNVQIGFDIACTTEDTILTKMGRAHPSESGRGYYADLGVDALSADWRTIPQAVSFLNPPFKHIAPWAQKCSIGTDVYDTETGELVNKGTRIFALFPASVGSEWFARYVEGKAAVYFLRPRIAFVDPRTGQPFINPKNGAPVGINRDMMLIDWAGPNMMTTWRWKEAQKRGRRKANVEE
jgi:hypothetical protein